MNRSLFSRYSFVRQMAHMFMCQKEILNHFQHESNEKETLYCLGTIINHE